MTRTTNEFICDMSPEEYEDATLKAELMTLADIDAVMPRRISSKELADLPEAWNNPTVDTTKYYNCVMSAVEVSESVCRWYGKKGGLWQKHNNRFYIA